MKVYDYECPIDATLNVIGGKWKASCVYYLINGPKRYSELFEVLETVSSRILSKQLKELEAQDIIKQEVFPESPPKVVYSLTE
ncbi:winged helix-turn-helix transcriptional regulator [Psychroserpens algicola]|uniref:Helix-turn-helix transcriptional regulator n=1 Tax=Psychroserpens algicola TaxID=1719034 RepID=A0ABT0H5Z6_9FLAO|nr:helix-turn-helix domain-containing protein [Psychroserpens algicola]MCK8479783.1 helix-turn-helix transcriptional regulator [Psychroserpens algicola]